MAQIAIEMTSDEVKALKAFERLKAKLDETEAKLRGVREEGKRNEGAFSEVGQSVQKAFDPSAILRFVGIAGAGGALLKGLQLIRGELENIRDLQQKAFTSQVSINTAQSALLRNLGAVSAGEAKQALETAREIATSTKVSEAVINQALAEAVSAAGGRFEVAAPAVRQAAKLLPDQPAEIARFSGALIDLAQVTGTTDAEVNAGLLAKVGAASRVVSPQQQARNIPAALIGARAFGGTTAEAAGLFSALTTGGADFEGALSATATVSIAQQLRDFLPPQPTRGGVQPRTMGERIAALQADPAAARRFVESVNLERKARGPLENLLLSPGSEIARQFTAVQASIGGPEDLAATTQAIGGNLAVSPGFGAASLQRAFASTQEQLMGSRPAMAEAAAARQGIEDVLQASGQSALLRRFRGLEFDLGGGLSGRGVTEAAAGLIQGRISEIEAPTVPRDIVTRVGVRRDPGRPLTEQETETVELLRELLVEIRNIAANTGDTARRVAGGPAGVRTGEDR